jgi:hypothetical protein
MKPVLLWPKPQSAISATLDRGPDDFTVVDTGSRYELQRLSGLQSDTPILDPFPGHGNSTATSRRAAAGTSSPGFNHAATCCAWVCATSRSWPWMMLLNHQAC